MGGMLKWLMLRWSRMFRGALLRHMLKKHEGLVLSMYKCPGGVRTIGYGHNLDSVPITIHAADIILEDDIDAAVQDMHSIFPNLNQWTDARWIAIVNMRFNLGSSGFRKFKKMIEALQKEDWHQAAIEMEDSVWHTQVGDRAVELVQIMESGELNNVN